MHPSLSPRELDQDPVLPSECNAVPWQPTYGEGLETGGRIPQAPRQSLIRQLFFKALKQNLKIKTFVGTSANALKIQIWTALVAMLILKYLQLKARYGWSLSNLVAFAADESVHPSRSLGLDRSPFEEPPPLPQLVQLATSWS
jgi:hypothetical protein